MEKKKDFTIKPNPEKKVVNIPECDLKQKSRTADEIDAALHDRAQRIKDEFESGFHAIRQYPKSVTIFGSARFNEGNPHYEKARSLSKKICEAGYSVITGGGSGIMEAGNRGTKEACGTSVGLNIELPFDQVINPYVTHGVNFHYFFVRKVALAFSAETYIYFPGGFGTLDEFFEILTLVQTKKIEKIPIILVGVDFWEPLDSFIKETLRDKFNTISNGDTGLYTITDDEDEIIKIIKSAKIYNEANDEHIA